MSINLLISFLLFIFTFFNWYTSLDSQSLGIKSAGRKLSNALSNGPFLYEVSVFFIGALLSIILIGLVAYVVSNNLEKVAKNKISPLFCLILTWLLLSITIFSLSSYFYHDLFFSHPSLANKTLIIIVLLFFSILLLSSFFISKNIKITSLIILILLVPEIASINVNNEMPTTSKPNVFIIGIDSLNQDEINEKQTPFLQSFIDESIYLPNTYTHVARTFPSWVSILTGDYPLTNKARLNLTNFNQIDLTKALPYYLKNAGYTNYYIQDERRFNNIDERFFFDRVIGPPATAAEFILSKFVDLPLLALTSKLKFFNYFMPHLQNNRAVWVTYDPTKFNKIINVSLHPFEKPVFVASHFTLPHWPYKTNNKTNHLKDNYHKYLESIKMVDDQVASYMFNLKSKGLLKNALIFIISDHGESFSRDIDTPKHNENSQIINLAGHGTSIVSNSQYKTLLSFKYFKNNKLSDFGDVRTKLNYAMSDITPTIIDILKLDVKKEFDGQSILKVKKQRDIPLESSLQPMFNSKGKVDINGTIEQNANLFEIDPLGKVIIRKSLYQKAVNSKQRGIIFDKWQLSIYPEHANQIYITDLESNILYKDIDFPNARLKVELLDKLCSLYLEEVTVAQVKPCSNLSYVYNQSIKEL